MSDLENRKPKFKKGDLVRHRASSKKAIVKEPIVPCVSHTFVDCLFAKTPCKHSFGGYYDIEADFGESFGYVDEDCLEKI